ncbi:MAG TPA: carboxypeptidase regulatory-like domain-containing protein [Acidobacteriaceae bacterium]|nr:carboxypeptidase regulatory-like domain-containing protein [Acidobacteriaceae bacterium]
MKKSITAVLVAAAMVVAAHAGTIHGKISGVKGVSVVYIQTIPGKTFPAPTAHPIMDQKGLMFVPHIMVVQQGTNVEFLNSDSVEHNVFWPSVNGNKKLSHNMGTWPQGAHRNYKYDHPGVIPLLCNVHPDMSGYIIVSPTPYFAETTKAGEFQIKDIPNGTYTITAWHEGKREHSQQVTVAGDATVNITLRK